MSKPLFTVGPRPASVWKYGDLLVVDPGACLPDRCLHCNAPSNGYRARHRIFSFRPYSLRTYLFFPIVLVVSYISERLTGQTPLIEAPLCEIHRAQRDRPRYRAAIALVVAVAGTSAAVMLSSPKDAVASVIAGIVGFYGFGIVFWQLLVARQVVRTYPNVSKPKSNAVLLNGVCDEYLQTLDRWPGAPRY